MKFLFTIICIFTLSIASTFAQKGDKQIGVKVKDHANLIIYVDEKLFDFPLELIDTDKIESIDISVTDEDKAKYNAPDGVMFVKTKIEEKLILRANEDENSYTQLDKPLIIIDGVEKKEGMDDLDPKHIEKIEVVKGERAINEFNAENGVIIITTKNYKVKFKKKKNKKKNR